MRHAAAGKAHRESEYSPNPPKPSVTSIAYHCLNGCTRSVWVRSTLTFCSTSLFTGRNWAEILGWLSSRVKSSRGEKCVLHNFVATRVIEFNCLSRGVNQANCWLQLSNTSQVANQNEGCQWRRWKWTHSLRNMRCKIIYCNSSLVYYAAKYVIIYDCYMGRDALNLYGTSISYLQVSVKFLRLISSSNLEIWPFEATLAQLFMYQHISSDVAQAWLNDIT